MELLASGHRLWDFGVVSDVGKHLLAMAIRKGDALHVDGNDGFLQGVEDGFNLFDHIVPFKPDVQNFSFAELEDVVHEYKSNIAIDAKESKRYKSFLFDENLVKPLLIFVNHFVSSQARECGSKRGHYDGELELAYEVEPYLDHGNCENLDCNKDIERTNFHIVAFIVKIS